MIDNPFFTVVIPTHNRSNLLKRAIASVLDQTFESFEIVIVDDHSTDDTSSVVKSFSDARIRYMINCRTKGACGARNTGIFAAKGKWVAFLDDDDVWLPEKLKYQHKKAKNSNNITGMICTDFAIIKDKQHKLTVFKNRPSGWTLDKFLYGYSIGCLSSVVIRSDILRKLNGFDERFPSSQDWDLWLRTAEVCQVTFVPKMLVIMHQETRGDRIGQNSKAKLAGHMLLREKYSMLIDGNLRLRHRHDSLIFTFAILEGNKRLVLHCLPWFLIGLYIDPVNFVRTIRSVIIFLFRKNFS
jgi:glycosyltransferase involved in cell wall biosynthesis